MIVRQSIPNDAQHVLGILLEAYGQNRYDAKYALNWIECFISNPKVFPSYVAVSEDQKIIGYIVWRVRQLSCDHQLTLELQELAATNSPVKITVEKLLFEQSPSRIISFLNEQGFEVSQKSNLDVWVHDDDKKKKSVIYGNEKPRQFLGGLAMDNARGEMLLLYRESFDQTKVE